MLAVHVPRKLFEVHVRGLAEYYFSTQPLTLAFRG